MDAVDPVEAPGVGTPVRGGITYREAHLAMETVCDSGRMTSMEVVEVNPVIDEVNRTALLAVELIMSRHGKEDFVEAYCAWRCCTAAEPASMRFRCAPPNPSSRRWIPARYDVQRILITKEGRWQPRAISPEPGGNPDIDVVFPVLHGTFGEDGTVQGLLELADLPYVGAGVLASAVSMDKEVMKRLMRGARAAGGGIRGGARAANFAAGGDLRASLPFPMFVKPANLGSSVGVSKAKTCEELMAALEFAAQFDRKIIVERGIAGPRIRMQRAGQ